MSKIKLWTSFLLTVIALALLGWNMLDSSNYTRLHPIYKQAPTYQCEHTVTLAYNLSGKLRYKLVAEDVKYYTIDRLSWLTQPVMTLFDKNALETWLVRADQAKITKKQILYLYGHVEVDSLTSTSQSKKIKTDNAQINLITQDISSDKEVTICGTNFSSNGMKMHGNLRAKTAELIDKVKASYEIKNQKAIL